MMADDPTLLTGARQLIRDELLNAEWAVRRLVREISGEDGLGRLPRRAAGRPRRGLRPHRAQPHRRQPIAAAVPTRTRWWSPTTCPPPTPRSCSRSGSVRGPGHRLRQQDLAHRHPRARAGSARVVGAGQASARWRARRPASRSTAAPARCSSRPSTRGAALRARRGAQAERRDAAARCTRARPARGDARRPPRPLCANIDFPEEVPSALEHGAEGIGLYRTEFLYLNREELPTRGGALPHATRRPRGHGAAGRRPSARSTSAATSWPIGAAARTSRTRRSGCARSASACGARQLFRTQLRALLRASVHGALRIMFPMISGVGELRAAQALVEGAQASCAREGSPFDEHIPVGHHDRDAVAPR